MADFYTQMRGVAGNLLRQFSQGTIQLVTTSRAAGSSLFEPGAETVVTRTLDGVVEGVDRRYVDGKTVVTTDKAATVSAVARDGTVIDPQLQDKLVVDGVTKSIKQVIPVPAAGIVVTWVLVLEG